MFLLLQMWTRSLGTHCGDFFFDLNKEDELVNMRPLFTDVTSDSSGLQCGSRFFPAVM